MFYNSKYSICRQPSWSAQKTDDMLVISLVALTAVLCVCCLPCPLHLKHTHEDFVVVVLSTTPSFNPV